jgi:hypothetical protein
MAKKILADVTASGNVAATRGLVLPGGFAPVTLNGQVGTTGQVLASNATATPGWVDQKFPTAVTMTTGQSNGPVVGLTMSGTSDVTGTAIPIATLNASGVVTTTNQTFAGIKTFGINSTGGARIANGAVFDYNGYSTTSGLTTLSNVPGSTGNITTPSVYISVLQSIATTATGSVGAEFRASTAASRTFLITFSAAAALQGSISTLNNATTYSTSSDYRMKENIVPMSNSIERLMALKPSRFNFIEYPGVFMDGFIAHEVQEIIPEAVVGEKDEVNEDGTPTYQGIDQSKMVPLLTAALQDAILKIEALEARIENLENNKVE